MSRLPGRCPVTIAAAAAALAGLCPSICARPEVQDAVTEVPESCSWGECNPLPHGSAGNAMLQVHQAMQEAFERSPDDMSRKIAQHFPQLEEALKALDEAYEGHAAPSRRNTWYGARDDDVSLEEENVPMKGDSIPRSVALTYGELRPESVALMLADAGARPGQRYYDLGSGTGKTVMLAWLLGLNATGVELVSRRYATACTALNHTSKLEHKPERVQHGARFVRGNFLEVDFSDADVVFTDSVMFSKETKEGLARAARRLKPGAKIVSFRGLPGPGLRTLMRFRGPTSWANFTEWTIQEVESGARTAGGANDAQAHTSNSSSLPETCSL